MLNPALQGYAWKEYPYTRRYTHLGSATGHGAICYGGMNRDEEERVREPTLPICEKCLALLESGVPTEDEDDE